MNIPRIAIVGIGNRGTTFSNLLKMTNRVQVTAVADPIDGRRNFSGDLFNIPEEHRFKTWQALLAAPEKQADAVIIAIQDALHCEAACAFANAGYQLFLEKPMAPTWEDCKLIAETAHKNGVSLTVCHELRYTPYYSRMKEIVDSGVLGKIENIMHSESVGYWHMCHSYVRGNWRNTKLSSFMLLAKSCHDMDIISYVLGKRCTAVSSFGSLNLFKAENAPAGAAKRCTDCPAEIEGKCPFSALKIYRRDRAEKGHFDWPVDVITSEGTLEGVDKALREGPYGRCVFACDNDVVDHQVVNMLFEDGITAQFTMTAFTHSGAMRETRICGTQGELIGDGLNLTLHKFLDDSVERCEISKSGSGDINDGHGGGDGSIIAAWVDFLTADDSNRILSGPEVTLESHRITFAAEESRLTGKTIFL